MVIFIASSIIFSQIIILIHISNKLMGLKKDFLLASIYFLILSTVLEAEDAFVMYRDYQNEQTNDSIKNNRPRMMVAWIIISLLNYFTLVLAPYFNCSIQKLSLAACAILLIKYGCELAYYTKLLTVIFELGAMLSDIVGTGLFYLSSLRVIQVLCEKHEVKNKSGLCFGVGIGLYCLSILCGYGIGYIFFAGTPTWLFVIALTSFTLLAACIAYFTFGFEISQLINGENNNNENREVQNNAQQQREQNEDGVQLFRDGLHFGHIFKFTLTTYGKILPLMGVQMMLGTLFAYGYSLLKYLIWTSQTQPNEDKLSHNMDTMIIYAVGGAFTSCLIGFICDRLPIRKLGYGLLVYNGLSLAFLYFALYIKYFYTTFLLFMFLGMTEFAVLVWLLAGISKLYKGIFQVIAANSQSIALAAAGYGLGTIFFEGRMNPQTKLGIELTALILMDIVAFLFIKKLPDDPVTINYLVEELEESGDQNNVNVERQSGQVERREAPVEIEMARRDKEFQVQMENQKTIDPQNLL